MDVPAGTESRLHSSQAQPSSWGEEISKEKMSKRWKGRREPGQDHRSRSRGRGRIKNRSRSKTARAAEWAGDPLVVSCTR